MSTLPRTKSLSGADTSSLSRNFRDRTRPSSLCEASWNKVYPPSGQQNKLLRTPSQANNLCTTVPTSIVNRTLGGRHTPTRSSLRHSRMAVMARNGRGGTPGRKIQSGGGGFGRMASLIILAYILVGVVGGLLAVWLVKWVPSLPFKEVPHYASGLIVVNGILALVLLYCLPKQRKEPAQALKILLILFLIASLLSCACVCVFDILHLINLAPMKCQIKSDIIIRSSSQTPSEVTSSHSPVAGSPEDFSMQLTKLDRIKKIIDDEEEGSGGSLLEGDPAVDDDEEGFTSTGKNLLEIETTPLSFFEEAQINNDIYVNVSACICHSIKSGWRIVMDYPNLTCDEVKNVLPIFLVASCVVTAVGAVLSTIFLYIVWTFRKRLHESYETTKQCEVQPFIYKSNFKLSHRHSLSKELSANGSHSYR